MGEKSERIVGEILDMVAENVELGVEKEVLKEFLESVLKEDSRLESVGSYFNRDVGQVENVVRGGCAVVGKGKGERGEVLEEWMLEYGEEVKYREVKGGFLNMSGLVIPVNIRSILSMGPKYMLPSFTLVSEVDKARGWIGLLDMLGNARHVSALHMPEKGVLKGEYEEYIGDGYKLTRKERLILGEVIKVDAFFKENTEVQLVEGDKGKMVGVLKRGEFISLCNNFIEEGLKESEWNIIPVKE